jgi:uncharacterized surface protein with fasciclin (FAS1) repeats
MNRPFLSPKLAMVGASAAVLALAACNRAEEPAAPAATTEPPPSVAPATTDPMVGGVAMSANDTIVTNAAKAPTLTTLVSAIQAAGLADTLNGAGPFTVFAPDNAAFEKIAVADREALMQPAQRAQLTKVLTYHVVPGRLTAADIAAQAQANGGTATLTTVEGSTLTVRDAGGGRWTITDEAGNTSTITQADVAQSNGVVHVIDTVLMPR